MRLRLNKTACIGVLLVIVMKACILFKKQITKAAVINIIENNVDVNITSDLVYTKYINLYHKDSLYNIFIKEFISEAQQTDNVTLVFNDEASATHNLTIKRFTLTETSKIEKLITKNQNIMAKKWSYML